MQKRSRKFSSVIDLFMKKTSKIRLSYCCLLYSIQIYHTHLLAPNIKGFLFASIAFKLGRFIDTILSKCHKLHKY